MSDKDDVIDTLSTKMLREFASAFLGRKLGSGLSRDVFDHATDPSKVIKVENSDSQFQNVKEWHIWGEFGEDKEIGKWLAPCHFISPGGTFLIMDKAFDIQPDQVPKQLPSFLTDHKSDNYGMVGMGRRKRIVCRDYGFIRITMNTSLRKWRA